MDMKATVKIKLRARGAVLIVSRDGQISNQLKQGLYNIGYTSVSSVTKHVQGLERFKERHFALVLFDAVPTNMSSVDFVTALKEIDPTTMLIALSYHPPIDQVFELLKAGARWFLVLPFTVGQLEDVLLKAIEGPPFSEGVLESLDRNGALVGLVLNTLENLTMTMHHLRAFPESPRTLDNLKASFAEAVQLARTFSEGGDQNFRDKLVEACIGRAGSASTRLGRVRKKLKRLRGDDTQVIARPQ